MKRQATSFAMLTAIARPRLYRCSADYWGTALKCKSSTKAPILICRRFKIWAFFEDFNFNAAPRLYGSSATSRGPALKSKPPTKPPILFGRRFKFGPFVEDLHFNAVPQ